MRWSAIGLAMTPWYQTFRLPCRLLPRALRSRPFSTAVSERVEVRCGSAGHVAIDLFNTRGASSSKKPLLVYLPPFPSSNITPQLPSFLHDLPVASINYRWSPYSEPSPNTNGSNPLHWPTPVHDTAFAMTWLLEHLKPPTNTSRDIYVYGSYLGASLATSLALTEANTHKDFAVRGLLAYNGIYNWTMFLPDHPRNRTSVGGKAPSLLPEPDENSHLHSIYKNMPALFHKATNLFDPFASPSLFFHCPGLEVGESFFTTAEHDALINSLIRDEEMESTFMKAPRTSYLRFPPAKSGLKIPQTLIVYESAPPPATLTELASYSFRAQAAELARMMRRSIDEFELKQRFKLLEMFDDDECLTEEAARRVQIVDAGPETGSIEPGDAGCEIISSWIENRF